MPSMITLPTSKLSKKLSEANLESPCSVEKLLFLRKRANTAHNATLMVRRLDVYAWVSPPHGLIKTITSNCNANAHAFLATHTFLDMIFPMLETTSLQEMF